MRLANQDQKRCLESVVGVVGIADDATADTQDHRAMAAQECGKRARIPLADETVQQLPIGSPLAQRGEPRATKSSQQAIHRTHELGGFPPL